jgi:hypothetical protein
VDDEADEDTDVDMMTDMSVGKRKTFRRVLLYHTAREHVEKLEETSDRVGCAIEPMDDIDKARIRED